LFVGCQDIKESNSGLVLAYHNRSDGGLFTTIVEIGLVAIRFIDSQGRPTEVYPLNPNGSPAGITGVQTPNGRVLALMPHPERVAALESNSWYPPSLKEAWKGTGPWFRMFQNARWCN
jgi:phosphoribosylformylglycinamidine synthase